MKCRFQDNLEFLQWVKRYWDQYYPGGEAYDAIGRRGGAGMAAAAPPSRTAIRSTPQTRSAPAVRPAPRSAAASSRPEAVRSRTPGSSVSNSREVQDLKAQVAQSDETIRGLEKERDFYFNKLRDIEILVQQFAAEIEEKARMMGQPVAEESDLLVKEIQAILYSTEVIPSRFIRQEC